MVFRSKWTLYNLSRVTTPPAANKTFFQQKWLAKSMLRSYHNPDVREGTWTRMFDRRLPAVVPMDHRYLARYDGSEMASGRGSGVEKPQEFQGGRDNGRDRNSVSSGPQKTPYMHMTFHPLERRLDTAIFRALFASSVRQARQMVVHGFVKVNGKKMVYPGYALNPGDMFSVDPERVMFSTGAQKVRKDSTRSAADVRKDKELKASQADEKVSQSAAEAAGQTETDSFDDYEAVEEAEGTEAEAKADGKASAKTSLKQLLLRARSILDESKRELSGKRQRELRTFAQEVRKTFSKIRGIEESALDTTIENFQTTLSDILTKVPAVTSDSSETPSTTPATPSATPQPSNPQLLDPNSTASAHRARKDAELLHAALERARANPVDVTKPYATPWRPREFMSAFAFIPRYLEVNQNVCAAVYLRHPVARPGLAEVPTPFNAETLGLGFNWYLRRR